MNKFIIFFSLVFLTINLSFSQNFKRDNSTQIEKENPMNIFSVEEISMLDILESFEAQGIRINKFNIGEFDKKYNIILLSSEYGYGKLVKTDTIYKFENTYHYFEPENKSYYDFIDRMKLITKDEGNKSTIFIKTYAFSTKKEIELDKENKNSFFNWRIYKETGWKLNENIPLMIFASSWKDKKYGFDRFCGVTHLKEGEEGTNELLESSPHYIRISYKVIKK